MERKIRMPRKANKVSRSIKEKFSVGFFALSFFAIICIIKALSELHV